MPATTSPFFGINYGWTTGEAGWGDPVNSNFKVLSFLGKGAVDSFVAALPGSPSDGDSVVLSTDNKFYVRIGGAWLFIQPQEGQEVNETSTGKRWQFGSGVWTEIASSSSLAARVAALEQFDVDLLDPEGSEKVGWQRSGLVDAFDSVRKALNYQNFNIWEFDNFVTSKPTPSDPTTWDWSPALAQALAASEALTYGAVIEFPRSLYKFSTGFTLNYPHTSINGNGSTFDASALITGAFISVNRTSSFPDSSFGTTASSVENIRALGPGRDSVVDFMNISGSGVGPTPTCYGIYCTDFRRGIDVEAGGYLAHFFAFECYLCDTALFLPTGSTNLGENIAFFGGKIHGCRKIMNSGALDSSIHFSQVSFDFNGKDGSIQWDITGGFVSCSNCHWEMGHVNTPTTGTPLQISGDQVGFNWEGGTILVHDTYFTPNYFVDVGAGASVKMQDHRMFGVVPVIAIANGLGYFKCTQMELGNTSRVGAFGKDQSLFDYGFEQTVISDLIYITSGLGAGTNRHTGDNIILTNSTVVAATGTRSLRAQKNVGTTSTPSVSFDVAVPAKKGQRFSFRFKCIDNNNRGGGAMFATARFGKFLGTDGNGIPVMSLLSPFITYSFTPTNAFTSFFPSLTIPGGDSAACPDNCDYFVIKFNINNFNGGTGPAPEGGWYSLYFDDFEIYSW